MKTIINKTEYCECCGVDFTNRPYAQKISHQNQTCDFNVDVHLLRFKEASNVENKLYEMHDFCDINVRVGYETSLQNANCLIKKYWNGFIDRDGKLTKCQELALFIEQNKNKIKDWYNEIVTQ